MAAERGITVVDLAPISDLVAKDETMLTDDGLHPSAKQYAGWVELIVPAIQAAADGPAVPVPSASGSPSPSGVG